MNKKEQNLSNTLKKYYQQEKFFIDKIESRMTTAGIPDLLVLSPNGVQKFVELKVAEDDYIVSLTPGQKAWHSRRNMRNVTVPFVILVEPKNKLLVVSSKCVLRWVLDKGGKIPIEDIPEECWFNRTKIDYTMLTYATTDLYFSSPRVYK